MRKMSKEASQDAKQHIILLAGKLLKVKDHYPKSYQLIFKVNSNVLNVKKIQIPSGDVDAQIIKGKKGHMYLKASQSYVPSLKPNEESKGTIVLNFEHPVYPHKGSKMFYKQIQRAKLHVGHLYTCKGYGVLIYQPIKRSNKWFLESSHTYDVCDDSFGIWESYEDEHKVSPWAKKTFNKHHKKFIWLVNRLLKMRAKLKRLVKHDKTNKAYLYASRYAKILDGYQDHFTPMMFIRPLQNAFMKLGYDDHWMSLAKVKFFGIHPDAIEMNILKKLLEIQQGKKLTQVQYKSSKNQKRLKRFEFNENDHFIKPNEVCKLITRTLRGLKNHEFD